MVVFVGRISFIAIVENAKHRTHHREHAFSPTFVSSKDGSGNRWHDWQYIAASCLPISILPSLTCFRCVLFFWYCSQEVNNNPIKLTNAITEVTLYDISKYSLFKHLKYAAATGDYFGTQPNNTVRLSLRRTLQHLVLY